TVTHLREHCLMAVWKPRISSARQGEVAMRLFEAILEANHQRPPGQTQAELNHATYAESLPVIALTCIDPRLNALLPEALGIGPEDFIWLRNAANIITGPLSSTMRSLALACATKGGREIAILGHSDCKVRQATAMDLIQRFRTLGIDRAHLPENLNEFFGLFASERQNVIRGVEFARGSPLIGPGVPVHGLLIDINTGRLEWVVNGYENLPAAPSTPAGAPRGATSLLGTAERLIGIRLDELKFPEGKIGETVKTLARAAEALPAPALEAEPAPTPTSPPPAQELDPSRRYRIIGSDEKVYGPVSAAKVLEWLGEGRIDEQTPAQPEGETEWKPLGSMHGPASSRHPPVPPRLPPALSLLKRKR
ncbi:MAG: carbonic anhydrase, partial [Verrucomicrobia bacterium]|nr:carbonic anhydrase [Verrucomicrobiota bacterium]